MHRRKSISKKIQAQVFQRDQWCCRYCGNEVFFSPALKVLDEQFPGKGYYHKNGKRGKMSKLLLNRCAAIDHIHPSALGGTNDIENLICACWECNSKKSNDPPQQWIEKIIKIEDLALADHWDGFLSIFLEKEKNNAWAKCFT